MYVSLRVLSFLLLILLVLPGDVDGSPAHQGERQKRNILGAALNIANLLGVSPFNPPLIPSINLVGINLN